MLAAYSGVISMFLFNAMKAVLIYRKSGMLLQCNLCKIIVVGALVFGATMYLPVEGFWCFNSWSFVLAVLAVNRTIIASAELARPPLG